MLKLRKKDTVIVIAGKDKGKKGEVKELLPVTRKVVVMGINIVSKHKKTTKEKPGGIPQDGSCYEHLQRAAGLPQVQQTGPRKVVVPRAAKDARLQEMRRDDNLDYVRAVSEMLI